MTLPSSSAPTLLGLSTHGRALLYFQTVGPRGHGGRRWPDGWARMAVVMNSNNTAVPTGAGLAYFLPKAHHSPASWSPRLLYEIIRRKNFFF